MERNRNRAASRQKRDKKETGSFGTKLALRVFGSILLILAAIFIKQNVPYVTALGREALSTWTVTLPAF